MATSRQLRDEIAAGRRDAALAALYGGSKSVLDRQRSRYCAALDQFELYYGPGRQVQVYSAPGRTELGGNHTDHQHGYGLAGAVTLDLVAVASRNEDGFIRVKSRGFNKLDVIDLTEAEPQQGESTHSASLIRGIADGFRTKEFGIGGFDAYTASDVLRGSGLSSSAAFEMGMAVILNTEYGCGLDAPALARICQFAENAYFGKPSGLLDQLTSAVGGVLFADFADPAAPKIEKIHADGVLPEGMTLCVTDTRASHSELTGEFAAIRKEMEAVAACLGGKVLGEVSEARFWQELPRLRERCGDRAVLRAIHYFEENARTLAQREALTAGTSPPLSGWWRRAATPPLNSVRTSTAPPRPNVRACRRRWPSARASSQGAGAHGGCRAAALPGRYRPLCRMHWWSATVPQWNPYSARAAAICFVCGSRGRCRSCEHKENALRHGGDPPPQGIVSSGGSSQALGFHVLVQSVHIISVVLDVRRCLAGAAEQEGVDVFCHMKSGFDHIEQQHRDERNGKGQQPASKEEIIEAEVVRK